MIGLEFLSSRPAASDEFRPRLRSPLDRALGSTPVGIQLRDLSLALAKFEVRGDLDPIDEDLVRITPRRGLVFAPYAEGAALEARLREQVVTVIDVTGALAALRIEAPDAATLMRRLTDLDLDRLPAVGAVGRVPALVCGGGDAFELFWPQEYGHYLAQVVVDTADGLGKRRLRG
jgi:sarcosine oxidase gamma subunit